MRTRARSYLCLLVAVFATGCETLRGARSDCVLPPVPTGPTQPNPQQPGPAPSGPTQLAPPTPLPNDPANQPEVIPGGLIVATGGSAAPVGTPVGTPSPQAPGNPLAPPRAVAQGGAGAPNGPPPMMPPPLGPSGSAAGDPHSRVAPSVSGGRWGLGPYETPADRLLELTRNLDDAHAKIRDLNNRIKELEMFGASREQALAEAARELDSVTANAAQTRATLQAQVIALQNKLAALEDDEIKFLNDAIRILERRAPPAGGKP